MSDRPHNSQTNEDSAEILKSSGNIRSRDEVVESVVRLYDEDDAISSEGEEHQLRRLIQALRNRKDRFGLIFAVSNETAQRKRLTHQIKESLHGQHPVEIQINEDDESLLDKLLDAPSAPEPLIVYGLENLLPSTDKTRERRERTLAELQMRREQFRNLGRPLLLWMPEYVYTMIGQQAVDFWSWQGGAFFFTAPYAERARLAQELGWTPSRISSLPDLRQFVFNFEGREEEIEKLLDVLRRGNSALIHGMGGMGKSSLALYLAKNLISDYPDAQLFISLKGSLEAPRSAADGLREAILAFRPNERLPDEVSTLVAFYRTTLQSKHAVIVINDVPDQQTATLFLPPRGSIIIMTSRERFTLPDVTLFEMAGLSPDEARKLLMRIAPRISQFADAIAELCGYVPMALRLAACALAHNRSLAPAELIERLKERREGVGLIKASLGLNYDLLEEELKRCWRMLAVFPHSFDEEAGAAVLGLEADAAKVSLTELESHCLLEWNHETERYYLHDLAREFADAEISDEERAAAERRHSIHYQRVLARADDLYLQGHEGVATGLRLFDLERANIKAGYNWAVSRWEQDEEAARLCINYPGNSASVLYLRLNPWEFTRWEETALSASRLLKDRRSEGNALGNLGLAYSDLGEVRKAIEYYEQALLISREIGSRRGEGNALGNLGLAYSDLGEARKAIEYHEQALAISREIGSRHGEGGDLSNLGNAYVNLGELRKAIEHYEQALVIAREIGDRRSEGVDLARLGISYSDLGEVRKAIEYFEQALIISREIGDRRNEGTWLGNLGTAYGDLGEMRKAIEYFEQALVISLEIGDRRNEGAWLGNLGNVYSALGEVRKAIEHYEQALVIAREIEDCYGEGNTLGNLGNAYRNLGEVEKAIELMEAALKIFEEIESPSANTVRQWLEKLRGQ